ncbi:NAD(P)-binding protein [Paramyrothecium foliicola]|nr:NAD(P)-binding protein [Paramyrothecium foliicola]
MTRVIRNIAIAGISGNAGSAILEELIQHGAFAVTALVRKAPPKITPEVTVEVVDFESSSSLAAALEGQDAFIDATSTPDPSLSLRLVDAAVASGVYRFIPSEFSSDPDNSLARALPVFQGKAAVYNYLQKLGGENKITWTALSNHALLDWALRSDFAYIDFANRKVALMNGGTTVIPWTLLSSVGKAVAGVLSKPEETKNRVCYVYSVQKSQKELFDLTKQALGSVNWVSNDLDMNKELEEAKAKLASGQVDFKVIADIIRFSISTPGYINALEKDDNELLGVPTMSDEEVKQLIKRIAAEKE